MSRFVLLLISVFDYVVLVKQTYLQFSDSVLLIQVSQPVLKDLTDIANCIIYTLDDRTVGVSSPGRVQEFSVLYIVQTDSGVHLNSYPMGTGRSLPAGKAARAWSWQTLSVTDRGGPEGMEK
jgi:hypothetical protein